MKSIICALAMALMTGCVAVGAQVTEDQAASFVRGASTQADVEAKLGRPTSVMVMPGGERHISYSFVKAQARPESYIPIVGAFVGGADSVSSIVVFRFDADGKLIDHTLTKSEFGAGTGFAAGAPPIRTDQPR